MADLDLDRSIQAIREAYDRIAQTNQKTEAELQALRISNIQKLAEEMKKEAKENEDYINNRRLQLQKDYFKAARRLGLDASVAVSDEEWKQKEKQLRKEIELKKGEDKKAAEKDLKDKIEAHKKFVKEKEKIDKKSSKRLAEEALKEYTDNGGKLFSRKAMEGIEAALKEMGLSGDELESATKAAKSELKKDRLDKLAKELSNFTQKFDSTINDVASHSLSINTRLQGWTERSNDYLSGGYWGTLQDNLAGVIGGSPLIKQSEAMNNLASMVNSGIAFNVEQRAFLETAKTYIADTFSATNETLLRLVRLQQEDTTAARLGMESALTSFLNNMYETSEYMQQTAQSIKSTIEEASALMTAQDAVSFEYQVQKWLGSLYSVGFSSSGVQSIAGALAGLSSGNISSISDGGIGNLLVMAANRANLSVAEILAEGLDESNTNLLLQAVVEYLGEIYEETKGSNVVAQQLAGIFNLTASDLKAAANLSSSVGIISKDGLGYTDALSQLTKMAESAYSRTTMGQMLANIKDNLIYGTASTLATNPVLYGIYSVASMVKELFGGGNIPFISAMGTGVDLATNISDLLMFGALGGGLLGNIGSFASGLVTGGDLSKMLTALGIGGEVKVQRGTGEGLLTTNQIRTQLSNSGFVGNSDSSDVQTKTLDDAYSSTDEQMVEAMDSSTETKLSTVDEHIVSIYNLLSDVITGVSYFHVGFDSVYTFPGVDTNNIPL